MPQLTTPTWTQEQFHLHTKGLPESRCGKRQESAFRASHVAKMGGSQCPGLRRDKGERIGQAVTLQESRPSIPAQSMSSLMILVLLSKEELILYFRSQSLFSTIGTATSLRW